MDDRARFDALARVCHALLREVYARDHTELLVARVAAYRSRPAVLATAPGRDAHPGAGADDADALRWFASELMWRLARRVEADRACIATARAELAAVGIEVVGADVFDRMQGAWDATFAPRAPTPAPASGPSKRKRPAG